MVGVHSITPEVPPVATDFPESLLTVGEVTVKDAPSGRPSAERSTFRPRRSSAWAVKRSALPAVVVRLLGAASVGAIGARMVMSALAAEDRYATVILTVPGDANVTARAVKLYCVC